MRRERLEDLRGLIDTRLDALAPMADQTHPLLSQAVRYALLAPGKRLRPTLALLAAEQFGGKAAAALDPGCAIEMVHAASLILDDLPCMDDATLRRGQPAVHRRFGEDVAVLAAVALLNEAYGVIARADALPAKARLRLVRTLSEAVGFDGLVAGQLKDLRERRGVAGAAGLHELNRQKTGVLFIAAVEAGAVAGGATGATLAAAQAFAEHLGSAFQILDDLVDATATRAQAGKDVGQDAGKPTLVSLLGLDAARAEMSDRLSLALQSLDPGHRDGPLATFTDALFAPYRQAA